jgi:hypothetical protein
MMQYYLNGGAEKETREIYAKDIESSNKYYEKKIKENPKEAEF